MNREKEIFCDALERSSKEEREAFIREACKGDPALQERVRSLLEAHESAGAFLTGGTASELFPEGGTGPDLPPEDTEGATVGRYKLLQKIGEGGFGVVYLAEQREPVKRKVALKIVKLGMDTRQVVGRFEIERQALAMMEHPNIAKVLDGGATERGRLYFVMELVRGVTITQYGDENELPTRERLELFIQICQAIQHAHQKGIVHRDIKPNNVLVTMHDETPVPKVIDFGIAKAIGQDLTDKTIFTRYHEFLGTPAYMSPEQTQMSGLDIDTRTDIYSLGVLLYELLTGRTPFDAKELLSADLDEIRRRIREEEPVKPSTRLNTLAEEDRTKVARGRRSDPQQLRNTLKGDLDRIVMKALEKDRSRRYESASAFAEDIRRYLNNEPVTAVAPSVAYRFGKFARRHRTALTAATLAIAVLLISTVASVTSAIRASQAEKAAKISLAVEQHARRELEKLRERADREALRARTEAATAAEVTRFLNEDLFAAADPVHEPDREIKLRTVLDRASEKLRSANNRLTNQPLVTAAIHMTVGRAYRNLSLYLPAEDHLRAALEIYEREMGERHENTIHALCLLAGAKERRGYTSESWPLAEKARRLALEQFGPAHPLTIKCGAQLAWNYYRLKKTPQAFQLAEEVYAAARHNPEADGGDLLSTMYLVARRRGAKKGGQFDAGEAVFQEAIAFARSRQGEDGIQTARAKTGLAVYYFDHNRKLDEAEALYLETLRIFQRVLGENHEAALTTHGNLGLLYSVQNRHASAQHHVLKVLEFRPEDQGTLTFLASLVAAQPLTPLFGDAGGSTWKATSSPPPPEWLEPRFDDSTWTNALGNGSGGEIWLRREFVLAETREAPLIFQMQGVREYCAYVNGVFAAEQTPGEKADPHFAVSGSAAAKALKVGTNVMAVRLEARSGAGLLSFSVCHFPVAE